VTVATAALWLRAVHAADARGLLPTNSARLTPRELAAEAARRGDDRLIRLVDGWYYPTSYGRVRATLSDDEADGLVASLEADVTRAEEAPPEIAPPVRARPAHRIMSCQLCGGPVLSQDD
jgi:hypothetical protein